ncbi:myocardin related transcription factor Ab [Trematomus bernacchii]|uniref:myocardin related transcription factor Ab n=1 Tax=Trematomus bernacchii TaxID=40690 RepID=UPI00146EB744|nr:myocardin related transcription factor Ab [Trematomus bernacchii]
MHVTPVFVNQQNASQVQTQAISLDLLKANGTPTLVTDSNGNHYLIALTNHSAEGQNGGSSLAKPNSRITLQRLQSTPTKLPSTDSQSKEPPEAEPIKKVEKAGLHLDTNVSPQPSLSAPPSLQPFFDDMSDSESQSSLISSLKQENGVNSQQMDDLFDILLKSGEIPGFKGHPDPSLAPLHSDPPSPASPPSPLLLHLSPPTPPSPLASPPSSSSSSARLEDFLESSTGNPLLGVEPDGGLTLIHDLHSQMLSTSSILDPHAPSPMDTSDLGFSPHPAGLDFDSMDWLDISMVRGGSGGGSNGGEETSLAPLVPHTPPERFLHRLPGRIGPAAALGVVSVASSIFFFRAQTETFLMLSLPLRGGTDTCSVMKGGGGLRWETHFRKRCICKKRNVTKHASVSAHLCFSICAVAARLHQLEEGETYGGSQGANALLKTMQI